VAAQTTPVGEWQYTPQAYAYDPATGNLISNTKAGTYTYTEPDHPHAVTAVSAVSSYTYDGNGNLIARSGLITTSYGYDAENRLISVTENGQIMTEYGYDGDGNRVMSIDYSDPNKAALECTVYIGNYYEVAWKVDWRGDTIPSPTDCEKGMYCLYLPLVQQGPIERNYYHADGVRIAVRETPGQVSWLYGDHLGSTSVTANAQGVMTSQTLYKAWEGTGTIDGRQGSEDGGMCVSPTSIYLNFFTLRQPRLRFRRFHPKGG
jgi:YD repeat-containing protein